MRLPWCVVLAGVGLLAALGPAGCVAGREVPDFCFLQVSDIHILPRPEGEPAPADGRSVQTIEWVCKESKLGQCLEPAGVTTPPPAFVAATGDLTEYGVIGKTWEDFEGYWAGLSVPLYVVPGNHDNTWTSIMPIMRKRHGGDHYSFDRFGCHFAMIDSATIQEPVPSLEARTLTWLREDLKRVRKDTPVFVFQHHPLATREFATPTEQLRFLEVMRGHHVVLLLMGHGHNVRAERLNGVDSVMGGSTFGPNAGYSIVSVVGGVLRVVYRYAASGKPMKMLLEKPIARLAGERSTPQWKMDRRAAGIVVSGKSVEIGGHGPARGLRAYLDGDEKSASPVEVEGRAFEAELPVEGLAPGHHFVVTEGGTKADRWLQATDFVYMPAGCKVKERRATVSAGMKARPVVVEGGCLVATTGGRIYRVSPKGKPRPVFETGVEILHAPTVVEGTMYFSSGELGVFAAGVDGHRLWRRVVWAAVYGSPAVVGDRVYVGDLEGYVYALDRNTGAIRWSKKHATYSIEMPVVASGGVLYFGAWDGFVYAVRADNGELKWKQPGPAGQTGEQTLRSRYYGPADCPPVVVGERLFVCDRSYRLGSYSLDGKYQGLIAEGVAAVGLAEDGRGFYARGLEKGLTRYDGEGKKLWSADVTMGRFPCPPTAAGGRVYACSNLGLLSVMDAGDGQVLAQYQVSPRLHIMAPVAVDSAGKVYVVGMDGGVTILDFGLGILDR